MMEDILLDRDSQQIRQKDNRMKYALVCVTLSVAVCVAVGLLMYGHSAASTSEAAEPFLGSTLLCGTCQIIPGVDTYKMCHTCFSNLDETTRLTCAAEESIIVTSVKSEYPKLRAKDISLVYNECLENRFDDGSCEFNLQLLRSSENYIEPGKAASDVPKDNYKVYYLCVSDDLFLYPEDDSLPAETEYSLSAVRWNDFEMENFPLLSSALVKCDKTKPITENWDKAKVCVTDREAPVTLTCDSTRTDVRILVAKVKTTNSVPLDKKFKKNLAKRTTKLCAESMSDGSCAIAFSDIFGEGDPVLEEGADVDVTYLCSYAPETIV